MGISVAAPGFSGSIIAITMGIYQDLLRIVSNPFKDFKKNVKYCIPLAIGMVISAVVFVLTFSYLIDFYPKATYLLFIGLIAGNIPVIYTEIKKCGYHKHYLIGGVVAFAAALALGVFAMGTQSSSSSDVLSVSWYLLAIGGFLGGVTVLAPGLSVTMVLIIVGVYTPILFAAEQLLHLNFTYFLPFAFFCVFALAGLVLSSRGIRYTFRKYPGFSNSIVMGLMLGALLGVLISSLQISDANFTWLLGGVLLLVGLGISILFVFLGKSINNSEKF